MVLSAEEFWGGSHVEHNPALAGGDTHVLLPGKRWQFLAAKGGSGNVVLKLPNAKMLPYGLVFHIKFFVTSDQPVQVQDNDGNAVNVYDANGVSRSTIDFGISNWGSITAIEIRLALNDTKAGTWYAYSWGEA